MVARLGFIMPAPLQIHAILKLPPFSSSTFSAISFLKRSVVIIECATSSLFLAFRSKLAAAFKIFSFGRR